MFALIKALINLAIRIIIALLAAYVVLHYINVYDYIDSQYIPESIQVYIDFAQNTSPSELWDIITSFVK